MAPWRPVNIQIAGAAVKTLRIQHIAKYFPPDKGETERFIHDLAREQARRGHKVNVLAHARGRPVGSATFAKGLTVTRARVWANPGGDAPLAPLLPFFIFSRALQPSSRPDIVHVHAPNPAGLTAAFLPRSIAVLLHWHTDAVLPSGPNVPEFPLQTWRFLEDKLLCRADAVVVTSPEYARSSPFLGKWQDKCRYVPLGLPEASGPVTFHIHPGWRAASFLRSRREGTRILAVGSLTAYKGFSFLAEALASLPGAALCLIGEGEEHKALEQRIGELGLKERVFLAGRVEDAERDACFHLCDIFCLPSITREETFGSSLLEAMKCGKPCVVTDVPGSAMTRVVADGENGLVCKPQDAPALTQALGTLLNSQEVRHSLGRAGNARFARLFSMPKIWQKLEAIYDGLAVRRG